MEEVIRSLIFLEPMFADFKIIPSDLFDASQSPALAMLPPLSIVGKTAGEAKVLHTGGHILLKSTIKALGLTKREAKTAIERLKEFNRVSVSIWWGATDEHGGYTLSSDVLRKFSSI